MKQLLGMTGEELAREIAGLGLPKYRAAQIRTRLLRGCGFESMTELPAGLREQLARTYHTGLPRTLDVIASGDGARKFLFELADGATIESVYLPNEYGNTVCASTQVGCAMGCVFCESCKNGLIRNLAPHEIYAQVAAVNAAVGAPASRNVSHVVLMGSGEPLANLDAVLSFFDMIGDESGLGIGIRNLSVSTCGLPEGIRAIAESGKTPTLAISLHAPTDELRRQLMPIARKYTIAEVVDAAKYYFAKTGRRVIIEYVLIGGVNCGPVHARQLAKLLAGLNCHVNTIALNGEPAGLHAPSPAEVAAFMDELTRRGVSATLRRSLGLGAEGACGQLKAGYGRKHEIRS